jgi:hypothetical protein
MRGGVAVCDCPEAEQHAYEERERSGKHAQANREVHLEKLREANKRRRER